MHTNCLGVWGNAPQEILSFTFSEITSYAFSCHLYEWTTLLVMKIAIESPDKLTDGDLKDIVGKTKEH